MKRITTLYYKEETFEIVKDNEFYLAINHKELNENGRLKRQLNGIQMHASSTVDRCIESAKFSVDFKELINAGYTKQEAFNILLQGAN